METVQKLISEYQGKAAICLQTIEKINSELKKISKDSPDAEWLYAERKVEDGKYMAYIQFVHDLKSI